ncbi:MAG: Ig-like domain-containing protein [Anaerolineae bacterium]|nr:Ig-like domain-containing protein [Anaerolineae bacterium]
MPWSSIVKRLAVISFTMLLAALPTLSACAPSQGAMVTPSPKQPVSLPAVSVGAQPGPSASTAPSSPGGCPCTSGAGVEGKTRTSITHPVVVAVRPERGEEQPPEAPIVVTFDQPMDPETTAAAFRIEPTVEGLTSVQGNTLTFRPARPLPRSTTFTVTVAATARSEAGVPLAEPFTYRFKTVGYLEVTSTQPADGAQNVSIDTAITVVFDRPVVPLTGADNAGTLPRPLRIQPQVDGAGKWLNTSVYTFQPKKPLDASTHYTVTIPAGLTDITGGVLAEDYVWTFTTAAPTVVSAEPKGNQVAPTTPITITFSQPMDPKSAEDAFVMLAADGRRPVPGHFTWRDDGRTMVFHPDQPLAFGAKYLVQINDTARAAQGRGTLRRAEAFTLTTVHLPAIRATHPADGDQKADPYGSLTVSFYSPIDPKTLAGAIIVEPKPSQVYTYYYAYKNRLIISWNRRPRTTYTVTLKGTIGDPYGNTMGQDVVIHFRTRDYEPLAYLEGIGRVGTYNAYTNTIAIARYRNVSELDFRLYRVDIPTFINLTGEESWNFWRHLRLHREDLVRSWSVKVEAPPNEVHTWRGILTNAQGNPLSSGLYLFEVRAPEIRYTQDRMPSRHLLAVSRLNLTLKSTSTEVLVWATDLKSGQPVANLPLRLIDQDGPTATGQTDDNGVFYNHLSDRHKAWDSPYVFAGEPGDEDFAVATAQWNRGITPWDFDLSMGYNSPVAAYIYTDRPIYRPGQTVHWKGIIRRDDDAHYTLLPPGTPITVTISDEFGNEVYHATVPLSPMGTVHGDFALDAEAGLGTYQLQLQGTLPELPQERRTWRSSIGFRVAEYRKPEYEIQVKTDRPEYVQGDTISTTVQAKYFFGGPVKNAKVRWTILSEDYFFHYQGDGWYSFQDFSYWNEYRSNRFRYGEPLTHGEGRTDDDGRFTFTAPADIADRAQSQNYTIDVRITDINGQEVASSTSAIVHKAALYLGIASREYVGYVGEPNHIDLITVDPQSRPIASIPVTVVVSQLQWYSVQEKAEDGRFYWRSKVKETPIVTQTLTTDTSGKASMTWVPKEGGQYLIRGHAADAQGHKVASSTIVWISSQTGTFVPWRMENNDRIKLVADKRMYHVGDTAEILVPSPYQGTVRALLTIERGHILSHRVITLTSNSEVLRIPILDEYTPNVFVSVVIVKGQDEHTPLPSFKIGYVKLPVSTEAKVLHVTLKPSAEVVEPHAPVTYTVEVRDSAGHPVQAELSLSLVDKAALALLGPNVGSMLKYFYQDRGVGVTTASGLAMNLDRLAQLQQKGAKGGGGGPGGETAFIRRKFPDCAFWAPTVQTDAQGRAQVSLVLPDNLTTWRMAGKAVTADTLVGEATVDIIATKDLLVRPVAPRFFVAGDAADLGAVVHNNTSADHTVSVSIAAQGATIDSPARKTIKVRAGEAVRVDWPIRVQPVDQVVLQFNARADGLRDAVELTLPVHRYTTPEVVGTSGEVPPNDARTEVIWLPGKARASNQGELTVTLEPTLAAGMQEGLRYLEHYPYECTEQALSRFLPNVLTYQALKSLGITLSGPAESLPQQVGIGLQRLYNRQNVDGGWGWWKGGRSQPFLSAYIVFGLVRAQRADFSVDRDILNRGIRYLEAQLAAPAKLDRAGLNRQAFIIYVLAEAGENVVSRAAALFEERERMSQYGQAFLGLALGVLDAEGQRPRIDTIISDLSSRAVLSATGAHWEEETTDFWAMSTDIRTTAIVLDLLARFGPTEGITPNVVRWLMSARKAGHWETTQETAWSLIALTDWMTATGELQADYTWHVLLNGAELGSGTVNRANLDEPRVLKARVARLLADRANRLVIQRSALEGQTGQGRLYYTTRLKYYLPVDAIEAKDRGVIVARRYVLEDAPERPITQAKVGDIIRVELTIIAPSDLHYLVVEDPLPAGAEAIDTSLRTVSKTYKGAELKTAPAGEEEPWWSRWLPEHTELRDEKVALFATWLPKGTYQYTYQIRASLPGRFLVLPATAYEMYFPEVWGRSSGGVFTIVQ